ncbi:MAG: hypothetical protein AB7G93_17250 [Bdellovibrionales bacterium]
MMKGISLAVCAFLSSGALAATLTNPVRIECTKVPYSVGIAESIVGGEGNDPKSIPVFFLYKENRMVASDHLGLVREGFAGAQNAYTWAFQTPGAVINVAVGGLQGRAPGTYEGRADMHVEANGHIMVGDTVPCKVTIQSMPGNH